MKTMTLSTAFVLAILSNLGWAGHDAGKYRRLDDLAFEAVAASRDLRWEIHDDFAESRDYRLLLRDAEVLADEVRQIVGAIWAERPDSVICREVETARAALDRMAARLEASDFATMSEGCYKPAPSGRGTLFMPPTRHPGYRHVLVARKFLARIDVSLCAIHDELSGGHLIPFQEIPVTGVPRPGWSTPVVDRPAVPVIRERPSGHHGTPVSPVSTPSRSRNSVSSGNSVELPLFGGKDGGIVLRFGR